ncbi:MFS transporter [Sutcliffiella cohnii]|uniref:MFS transporter n=1 Tax=Sutcliffiella cohnii TaxID=33932 RepID=UPI002E1F40F4|nr:MFS transporter [Sutcliffiella cohnii]
MISLFRNWRFTRLFSGRIITNMADSIYYIAAMWLVYELGGSAFHTGLAGFLVLLPQAIQFLAGPLVDRWSLSKTLFITQLVQGILIAIIPIAHHFNYLNITTVLIIIPLISLLNQFAYPAQTATLPLILKKDELVKGNSLFSFAYQGVDMAFNAIAGILISLLGVVTLFIIDSVIFFTAAVLFLSIRISVDEETDDLILDNKQRKLKQLFKNYWLDLTDGFKFVFGSIIAKLFVAIIVANFAIGATLAILPVYGDYLGGSDTYGYLMAALSAGTLIGALLGSMMGRFPLGTLTITAFLIGFCFWISSIFMPSKTLAIILFGFAWIPLGVTNVVMNSAILGMIPQKFVARTITVAASIGTLMMPIGSLLGGYIATVLDITLVFGLLSSGFLFISIFWVLNSTLRNLPQPVYMNAEDYGLPINNQKSAQAN